MSKRNIYKQSQINIEVLEKRMLDSNERIKQRIDELHHQMIANENGDFTEDQFALGLEAAEVSALLTEPEDVSAINNEIVAGPSVEELINEAEEKAATIIEEAKRQAETLKQQKLEEAMKEGYDQGYQSGYQEAMAIKQKLEDELEQKNQLLIARYQAEIKEIEPRMVDTLTDIYEHIFEVNLSDSKTVIRHLLENTLRRMEGTKEYFIHVSKDDYDYLSSNKEEIMKVINFSNVHIDIIEDLTLSGNQCLVETDNGIFDCSLGVELAELKKQLLLLSYQGRNASDEL